MEYYKKIIRPILFRMSPDFVHEMIAKTGYFFGRSGLTRKVLHLLYFYDHPSLEIHVFGIKFKNPVGIGGGFDKDCLLIQTLPFIGFGFTEVGSITALAYEGNKRPWNIRLTKDKSILVNYGLKNFGADVLSKRIESEKRFVPLVVNIAKTNDSHIKGDASIQDYNAAFVKLQASSDIINLNVSCPNSGDGELFCENPALLRKLLTRIGKNKITKPVVLKLKPDLSDHILYEIIDLIKNYPFIKGFIVSNLTHNRSLLKTSSSNAIKNSPGGISGKPLQKLSTAMIKKIYKKTKGEYPIIGLGGVFTAEDAYEKICNGASLIELVTGLIYGGPSTIKKIKQGLVYLLKKDGFENISNAVGSKVI